MALTAYDFEPAQSEAFAAFRDRLYQNDRNWIPPLRTEVRARFSPTFPFYGRRGNHHRNFIASAGGEVAGHATAFVNGALRDEDGTPVGTVGLFECIDDRVIAGELLGAAVDWLRCEHGIDRVWGPMDFDIWHGYRLMTEGFEEPVFLGEPYNKAYYPALFQDAGFRVRRRWNSATVTGRAALEALVEQSRDAYRSCAGRGYRFIPVRAARPDDVRELHSVMTRSFESFLGFTPHSLEDFRRTLAAQRRALDPRLMSLIRDAHGAVAGFAVSYPDHADAIRAMAGKDGLGGQLRFLTQRGRTRRSVFYVLGLTPEQTARRHGLGRAGFHHMIAATLEAGYHEVVMALLSEGNRSRKIIGDYAEQADKSYALYALEA